MDMNEAAAHFGRQLFCLFREFFQQGQEILNDLSELRRFGCDRSILIQVFGGEFKPVAFPAFGSHDDHRAIQLKKLSLAPEGMAGIVRGHGDPGEIDVARQNGIGYCGVDGQDGACHGLPVQMPAVGQKSPAGEKFPDGL